jgi:diguanylate cyclase (GGDEF)-like protein/PAS domain S-box-containing protein
MVKKITIGVLFPILDGFYCGKILTGLHKTALENNINLVTIQTMHTYYSEEVNYRLNLASEYVDGWIVVLNSVTDDHLKMMSSKGKPIVTIGRKDSLEQCTNITVDNFNGAKNAILHLIDHGHRNIAFIGYTYQHDIQQRLQGYYAALKERNIEIREDMLFKVSNNLQTGGQEAVNRILERKEHFSAIFFATDLNAIGAIELLKASGLRVPEDFAVFSFDDQDCAKTYNPPLSTIRQSPELLGVEAIKVLREQFSGGPFQRHTHVKTEIMIRNSCGCPKIMNSIQYFETEQLRLQTPDLYNYEFGITLSKSILLAGSDNGDYLSWLDFTCFHTGCLALWKQDGDKPRELEVTKIYNTRNQPFLHCGERFSESNFPSLDILNALKIDQDDIITLNPLRTETNEYGVLVLIGPVVQERISYGYEYDQTSICIVSLSKALERHSLMAQLRQSELRYRDFFNNTPVIIYLIDSNAILVDLNPYFLQLLGYSYEETIGKYFVDFLTKESYVYMLDTVLPLFRKNLIISDVEIQLVTKDGHIIDGLMNGKVIMDENHASSRSYMTIRDITERKNYEKKIAHIAYHDALTDLPNRLSFQKNFDLVLVNARQTGTKVALMLIDLNRFKWVNDTFGHDMGDLLLQYVAAQIKQVFRVEDFIARLGGDEFTVILPKLRNIEHAEIARNKIMKMIEAPFVLKGQELSIGASIGISIYPDDGLDAETLIKKADTAMYEIKAQTHE